MFTIATTKRVIGCGLTALVMGSSLVACASGSSVSSGNGTGYTLGFQAGLSGPIADAGQGASNGFKNAIQWQNDHGGVNGKKINVSYVDDRQDGTAAAAAYRQLAKEGALADFGMTASTETSAVQPLSDSVGVPVAGSTIAPFGKNVFNSGPDLTHEITAEIPLLNALAAKAGTKGGRVAVVYITTPAGVAAAKFATSYLEQAGYSVVASIGTPVDITSFSTQAATIANAKADYVLSALTAPGLSLAVPALRGNGSNVPIINFWAGASLTSLQQLKDPNLYVYRTFADPSEDLAATMRSHAQAQNLPDGTKYATGNYYTQGYVMGLVAINVLKECGASCSPGQFSSLLASKASNAETNGLAAKGSGFSPSNKYFVQGVHYWTWDATAGKQIPAPALAEAADYPSES